LLKLESGAKRKFWMMFSKEKVPLVPVLLKEGKVGRARGLTWFIGRVRGVEPKEKMFGRRALKIEPLEELGRETAGAEAGLP
jgi:hypothetical protein